MTYIDKIYMAAQMEWFENGKKKSIQRLTELLERTPPEYVWIRQQIESTIKQIKDDRPDSTAGAGGGVVQG